MGKKTTGKAQPSFRSLRAVLLHLDQAGFRISRSKIYRDKEKGMIRVQPDNTVLETEVRAYAATLERKDGNIGDLNDLHARKTAKEVESLDIKVKKQKFDFDVAQKLYIPKKDFEAELASRALVLESGFKHRINLRLPDIIGTVGGNVTQSPDLRDLLYGIVDEQLSAYATTDTYQVMFEEED